MKICEKLIGGELFTLVKDAAGEYKVVVAEKDGAPFQGDDGYQYKIWMVFEQGKEPNGCYIIDGPEGEFMDTFRELEYPEYFAKARCLLAEAGVDDIIVAPSELSQMEVLSHVRRDTANFFVFSRLGELIDKVKCAPGEIPAPWQERVYPAGSYYIEVPHNPVMPSWKLYKIISSGDWMSTTL